MFDLLDFIKTKRGRILISIIWGLGLATLFRKVCIGRNCIIYKAPNPQEMSDHVYSHDGKCYTYNINTTKCTNNTIS